jgi:antitoxin component YwqK of YwqJK toxin-antitoxin module
MIGMRYMFVLLLVLAGTSASAIENGLTSMGVDTPMHEISYGDEKYMIVMEPKLHDSYMPLLNDRPSANRSKYYRLNYEALSNGVWTVNYPKKKKPFLIATFWEGKPTGTWTYYYSHGVKMKEVVFNSGMWKGSETKWHPNGNVKYERTVDRTKDVCGYRYDFAPSGEKIREVLYVRDVKLLERTFEEGKLVDERTLNQPYHVWRNREQLGDTEKIIGTFKIHVNKFGGAVPEFDQRIMRILESKKIGTISEVKNDDGSTSLLTSEFTDYKDARYWIYVLETYGQPNAYIIGYINGEVVEEHCYR